MFSIDRQGNFKIINYENTMNYQVSIKPFNGKKFQEFDVTKDFLIDIQFELSDYEKQQQIAKNLAKLEFISVSESKSTKTEALNKGELPGELSNYDELLNNIMKMNLNMKALFNSLSEEKKRELIKFIMQSNYTRN